MVKAEHGVSVSARPRRPTATSSLGVSRRESHGSSEFYDRRASLKIDNDGGVERRATRNEIWDGDARRMAPQVHMTPVLQR